jgi:hypothetical protein
MNVPVIGAGNGELLQNYSDFKGSAMSEFKLIYYSMCGFMVEAYIKK